MNVQSGQGSLHKKINKWKTKDKNKECLLKQMLYYHIVLDRQDMLLVETKSKFSNMVPSRYTTGHQVWEAGLARMGLID